MSIESIHRFVTLAPPDWVDSVDAWFVAQSISQDTYASANENSAPPRGFVRNKILGLIDADVEAARDKNVSLELLLGRLENRGRSHAMKALAPFLASLTLKMVEGDRRSAEALMSLLSEHTAWTAQVEEILRSSDFLIEMADAKHVVDFGRVLQLMYKNTMQKIPYMLFERGDAQLTEQKAAEIVGALTWGPFEVARLLFEHKFSNDNGMQSRLTRAEDVTPIFKDMEHLASGLPPREILIMAGRHLSVDLHTLNLRRQVVEAVISLSGTLFDRGIFPSVDIPAALTVRTGCPVMHFSAILVELLMNAAKYKDDNKPWNSASIKWDGVQHAIVVEDNGIGISNVEDVWPDKLSESNAFGQGVAMQGSLFQVRNRLHKLTWKMTLNSEKDQGSRFSIYPPLGEVIDAKKKSQSHPPSGPPIYGGDLPNVEGQFHSDGSYDESYPLSASVSERLFTQSAHIALLPLMRLIK